MEGIEKHILLVVYVFPPSPGIGGRRWAKFAKYFTKLGYTVHVICSSQENKEISLWNHDVKDNPKIKVYGIIQKYPAILSTIPSNFIEKLRYKIALFYISLIAKGSLYDRSIFWKTDFDSLAERILLNNNIETAFVSIAPIHHAISLIKLKSKFPKTNFVADFRDLWANGLVYGFPQKNKERQIIEEQNEKLVCSNYDLITTSVRNLLDYLPEKYGISKDKFYLLEHGIDDDDFNEISNKKSEEKCKIIYNGNLYEGVKNLFDNTFEALKTINDKKFSLDFYVPTVKKEYFENAKELNSHVKILKALPARKFFNEMSTSNFVLIIYPDKNADFFTTKFAEIIHLKIPIIFIGKEGFVSRYLTENNLGICLKENEILEKLPIIISKGKMSNYNGNFDINRFKYPSITNSLLKRISELNH